MGTTADAADLRSAPNQRDRSGYRQHAEAGIGLNGGRITTEDTVRSPATTQRISRARRGEGDKLREEILAAATDLLIEKGDADKVSVRAIADQVGVTPPSVYLHFETKNDLMHAACEVMWDDLGGILTEARDGLVDPLDRLVACARAYLRFAVDHPALYRVLFQCAPDDQPDSFDVAKLLNSVGFSKVFDDTAKLAESGRLNPELDPLPAALLLWSTAHGVASLMLDHPAVFPVDLEAMANLMIAAISDGILKRDPR